MVVHGRPQTRKNTSFLGVTQPQGSHSPYMLGDTARPGHVTCVLVRSKSDQRRLRKTLHKQTDKQTDTTKIMVTWPWTNTTSPHHYFHFISCFPGEPGKPVSFSALIPHCAKREPLGR